MVFIVLALMLAGGSFVAVKLMLLGIRRPRQDVDPVPVAQIAAGGRSPIHSGQHRARPVFARVALVALGAVVLAGTVTLVAFLFALTTGDFGG
jgi:hypothetical protein